MGIEHAGRLLLWCAVLNYAVLIAWFLVFVFARDWLYRLHSRWFRLSPEQFDRVHYLGMAVYKILILTFNIVPFAAVWLVG